MTALSAALEYSVVCAAAVEKNGLCVGNLLELGDVQGEDKSRSAKCLRVEIKPGTRVGKQRRLDFVGREGKG